MPPKEAVNSRSEGVKGAIKGRIIEDMIQSVPGDFKIIVADALGTQVLNACLRMHNLMDHGVTLVEDIAKKRQPIPMCSAIYFIAPTEENARRITEDWETGDMYKEAHVFFVSRAENHIIRVFAGSRMAREKKLNSLKDMLISFIAPETLVFSLNERNDLPSLFGTLANLDKKSQMAHQLASVMHTIGELPVIRYQNTPVASEFAALVQQASDALGSQAGATQLSGAALLLVVDRSIDMLAPLLHDLFYQAMLEDFMPLTNNVYEQLCRDRMGREEKKSYVLDENDAHWCQYRHEHFSVCLTNIPKQLDELIKANPALTDGLSRGAKLSDLGAAVRALPQFQETKAKLSLHIDIIEKLFNTFKMQKFDVISDIEQRIVNGEDSKGKKASTKELIDNIVKLGGEVSIRPSDKLRLILLLVLTQPKEVTDTKLKAMLEPCGFTADEPSVAALRLIQQDTPAPAVPPPKGSYKSDLVGSYYMKLKTIMEQAVLGTLNNKDFPFTKPADAAKLASAATTGGASGTNRAVRPSLLSKARGTQASRELDLGHGEVVPLNNGPRIVVFVVGGVTRGETRCAYEVTRTQKREIIIGGTSIINPSTFLTQLPGLV